MANPLAGLLDPAYLKQQMLSQALMGAAGGLLSGRPSFGQNLGQGILGANQGIQTAQQNALQQGLMGFKVQEFQAEQAERDRKEKARQEDEAALQEAYQSDWFKALPPQQQSMFKAQPKEAFGAYIEHMFKGAELPSGYRQSATGALEYIPGGPADPKVAASLRTPREPDKPSIAGDFALPLLMKRARGETLSQDEQSAWDMYSKLGVLDQILRNVAPDLGTAEPTADEALASPSGDHPSTERGAPSETEKAKALAQAREAIAAGRSRAAVEKMLRDMGVDPAGL